MNCRKAGVVSTKAILSNGQNISFLSSKPNCVYKRRKETPFFIFRSCLSIWVFKILSLLNKSPKKDRSSSFTSKDYLEKETSIQTYFCRNMAPRFSQAFRLSLL
ncbi:hypothetical protein POPTR_015G107125v4 [Populus trichocarpa]|uniref:Uncharacterized protein n=1 Tax=Populus trichocarpa TaxID=3694 RepID=A0ACC0RVX7_POPTR|nr:hypothetical protein POPTR_015G107125v4 [Populus trichocarpa]